MKHTLILVILLLIQFNLSAQLKDTLFIYDLPHRVLVEDKNVEFNKSMSLKSREVFNEELKFYLSKFNYKLINDSTATANKALNKEFQSIFSQILTPVPFKKIILSESIKDFIRKTGSSKFIVFENEGRTLSYSKYLNRGLRNSLISNVVGIPTITIKANTSLNCFVIENEKVIHFGKSSKLQEPLDKITKGIMIEKVIRKFIKKQEKEIKNSAKAKINN